MRKIHILVAIFVFILMLTGGALMANSSESELSLEIDGHPVDTELQLEDGRVKLCSEYLSDLLSDHVLAAVENELEIEGEYELLPLRQSFENIGAYVDWDGSQNLVKVELGHVVERIEEEGIDDSDLGEALEASDNITEEELELVRELDVQRAVEHIRHLSEEIGTRPAGSTDEHEAAAFLADYYEALDYQVNKQEFDMGTYGPEEIAIAQVELINGDKFYGEISHDHANHYGDDFSWGEFTEYHGTQWEMAASVNGVTNLEEPLQAQVIDAGQGEDEKLQDASGEIALVGGEGIDYQEVVNSAQETGVEAVIFYASEGPIGNMGQTRSPQIWEADIPVLGASQIHGEWLSDMAELTRTETEAGAEAEAGTEAVAGAETETGTEAVAVEDQDGSAGVEISLSIDHLEAPVSYNVEAVNEADSDDAPIVAVTGHYDSVIGTPGANDNASGTAAAMEMARLFQDYQGDVELRFINFGAEEVGLVGSISYVSQLSEEELDRFKGVYNADMIATSDPYIENLYVHTVDGEINAVTNSMVEADERLGHEKVATGQFAASDHLPFHHEDIPAALFIHMAGEGTPEDYYIEPVYHTPLDTVEDNICPDRYEQSLQIIALAFNQLIN